MTFIGTSQEIDALKSTCDGRCVHGEWCVLKDLEMCPVDTYGMCLSIDINCDGKNSSCLNEIM